MSNTFECIVVLSLGGIWTALLMILHELKKARK